MPIERLPLVGNPSERTADSDKDMRLVNVYVEQQDKQTVDVEKRPGLLKYDDTAAGEGRGIVSFNDDLYAVVGNTIYKNGAALGTTIGTSTGRVSFDIQGGVPQTLLLNDKTSLYTVETDDTVTAVSDVDYPGTTVDGVVILDTYTTVLDANGLLHNSAVDDPTDWASTDNIEAQIKGDAGVAIARHINYLVALGEQTIEVFYDAANETGSPFSRLEGTPTLIGCAAGGTVVNLDKNLLWVAATEGGGRYVAQMEGFTPKRVSNHTVDKELDDEGANISSAVGYYVRHGGHGFYVLRLSSETWVYDVEMKAWHEWTYFDGATEGNFPCVDATEHNGVMYMLHATTGEIFSFDSDTYQDDSNDIKVLIQTVKFDGEVNQNKFLARLEVIGDMESSGNLSVSWSDDDYTTFTTARTVDLSSNRRFLTRCGHFQRRAFKLEHSANTRLRLTALELNMRRGHYGM